MLMFGSGSLDLTGLIMTGVGAFSHAITPSSAGIQAPFISLTRAGASSDMYRGLPPLPDLGPGTSLTFTGGGTGAGFGYQLTGAFTIIPSLRVPRNYVSGTFSPLTSVTFPNASFA